MWTLALSNFDRIRRRPEVVRGMVQAAAAALSVPVCCKIRILPRVEDTIQFAVMLEEEVVVTGERLAAVRRYEQSVNDHLTDMEALLAHPSRDAADYNLDQVFRPKAIVFFHNLVRGQLIAELFAAQGMEVCLASSASDALKLTDNNDREAQLGVFDQPGPAAEQLLKCHPRSILLYCNASIDIDTENPRIGKVTDQPMDINEVLRASVEMLSRF